MGNEQPGSGAHITAGGGPSASGGAVYVPPEEPWNWHSDKKMTEWDANDVQAYMHSLTYTETTRNVMRKKISGKDLLLAKTPQQLAEKLGIPLEKAEGIFEVVGVQKQRQMNGTKGGDPNSHFMGSQSWKSKATIYWTPFNVKSWFVSQFDGKVDATTKKKVLDAIDKHVLDGDRLSSVEDASTLAALFEVDQNIGQLIYSAVEKHISDEGDDEKKENVAKEAPFRLRKLRWTKYRFIKLSKKKDCIMGYTQEDGIDRAEMPCGHAVAADTMFYYIKSIIEKNRNAVFIMCPVPECDTEWDWNTCLRIADMDQAEIDKYNEIRRNRKPDTVVMKKGCPHCGTPTPRPDLVKNFRVACTNCKKGDWCFGCEQPWRKSGDILCGNANCTLVSGINDILQNCPMKEVEYLDCKIPKIRACPTCLAPIEHLENCKHMVCQARNCRTEFCFICLAVADPETGQWPEACREGVDKGKTNHRYQCEFAPRQYFV